MRKKVDVLELETGMYVAELDRPWRETPFLFQGFYIESQADIEKIRGYCQHVFVDFSDEPGARPPRQNPQDRAVELEMLKNNARAHYRNKAYLDTVTLEEELSPAQEVYAESQALIGNIMEDARIGRSIDSPSARKHVAALTRSVIRNPDALVCLAQLKSQDEYTVQHSLRVCILSLAFGRYLGVPEHGLRDLGLGALLHDVGKSKVPLEILNKPERLTEREFTIMRTHVPEGVKIVESLPNVPRTALEIIGGHHERYSGQGYMRGLQGREIGNASMIAAIVDCYDALTSDRVYQAAVSSHQALKQMYTWRDREFEGRLIEHFIQCMGIYPIGSVVELTTGHIGVVTTVNRTRYLRPQIVLVLNGDKQKYPTVKNIDLMKQMRDEADRPWEIKTVLEPGSFGVNPMEYLPLPHARLRNSSHA